MTVGCRRDAAPSAWQRTALAFVSAVESGRLDLPLPGSGRTGERWAAFADLAEEDLSLARLGEGHAARSRSWRSLTARRRVPAAAGACGRRTRPDPTWPATGMAASDTLDVGFPGVAAKPVGPPGGYTSRPGFSHGGAGVAARWYGGARGVARTPLRAAAKRDVGPHALAHLGAVDIALHTARAALARAAEEIDADPGDQRGEGPVRALRVRALRVRALTEAAATDVLARTGRALGAGPLSHDESHSRAVADLTVYLRQHHAERDLARLGALVAEHGASW